MSEENYQSLPSQEQIRKARHSGFDDSVSHMAYDRRQRLTGAHRTQDARREANVSGFYESVNSGN